MNSKTKTTKISADHILIEKPCGCKLHIFTTDQYEEPCDKHNNQSNNKKKYERNQNHFHSQRIG